MHQGLQPRSEILFLKSNCSLQRQTAQAHGCYNLHSRAWLASEVFLTPHPRKSRVSLLCNPTTAYLQSSMVRPGAPWTRQRTTSVLTRRPLHEPPLMTRARQSTKNMTPRRKTGLIGITMATQMVIPSLTERLRDSPNTTGSPLPLQICSLTAVKYRRHRGLLLESNELSVETPAQKSTLHRHMSSRRSSAQAPVLLFTAQWPISD